MMPNNNEWTEARFRSFIMSALRKASMKWPPKYRTRKEAKRQKGYYLCAGYKRRSHKVKPPVYVDHIEPVIDPAVGFYNWDSVIERLFVEDEGLQVLCKSCHDAKTADERKKK